MNAYRSAFDPWLASLATAAGAELRCSTLLTGLHHQDGRVAGVVDEHGTVYRAPIVVGADGVLSTVAREAGIRERWKRDEVVLVPQLDFADENHWYPIHLSFHELQSPSFLMELPYHLQLLLEPMFVF